MTNSSYHHGDLKPALIQAARTILRKSGAGELSLRTIAAAIGVSHMAPYAHFASKQELLQAVAADGFDELTERMLAAQERTKRTRDLALNYGIEYIQFALENPELYRIMMSQLEPARRGAKTGGKDGAHKPIAREIRLRFGRPFRLLHAAFANGRIPRKIALARALGAWSTVHGMSALIIDGHMQIPEGMDVVALFKAAVGRTR